MKNFPKKILYRRGNKAKTKEIKKRFDITVNHKRIARICGKNGLLSKKRRRKFPKEYYKRQKENKKNLQKNILTRDFSSKEPLKKLCTDVSNFKTTESCFN
ncbi:MAG: IS3 family transposase [Treponema sp.]